MANTPASEILKCPACGGTFFIKNRAEQFVKAGYGSAEFRSKMDGSAAKTILQCMGCLSPVTPQDTQYARSSVAMQDEMSFRASIEAGRKYRTQHSGQSVAQVVVSPAEFKEVKNLVDDVRKQVNAMTSSKAPQPKEAVAKAKAIDTE